MKYNHKNVPLNTPVYATAYLMDDEDLTAYLKCKPILGEVIDLERYKKEVGDNPPRFLRGTTQKYYIDGKWEERYERKPLIGTMAADSQARKMAWLKTGCNAYESKNPKSQPMSFWTEQDVLQYIKENNLPYASVYGDIIEDEKGKLKTTGCDRTGCVFCAFGCHLEKEPNRFQRLKQTHPNLWEYCMKDWENGGLGMKNVLDYINVKTG